MVVPERLYQGLMQVRQQFHNMGEPGILACRPALI